MDLGLGEDEETIGPMTGDLPGKEGPGTWVRAMEDGSKGCSPELGNSTDRLGWTLAPAGRADRPRRYVLGEE